jgi:Protein of unknown function (DUF1236)
MRKVLVAAAATIGLAATAGLALLFRRLSNPDRRLNPGNASRGDLQSEQCRVQATGSAHLSHDRAAKIAHAVMATASPQEINIDVMVGADLPGNADVRALPPAVVALVPEDEGYEYVVATDVVAIVHPFTRRVVEVIRTADAFRARAAGPRRLSRRRHLAHAALGTRHSRHTRVQQRAVLEEIQMPPGLVFRVVDRAALAPALRAGEPTPPRKIHV